MTTTFSTDGVRQEQRPAFWRAFVERNFGEELHYRDGTNGHFDARVEMDSVGPIGVFRSHIPFATQTRGFRDRSGDFLMQVGMQLSGASLMRHAGHEARLEAGDVYMLDGSQDYEVSADPGRFVFLTVPYKTDPVLLARARDLAGVRIAGQAGAGAIVSRFVEAIAHEAPRMAGTGAERLLQALVDTVNVAVFAGQQTLPRDKSRQRSYLKRAIRLYVEEHLRDPEMTPPRIAEAHGISRRSMNRVFEDEPMTVSQLIWERRLAHSRRDLRDPALSGRSVTEIAYHWGFSSSAHFSRAFKARFGQTPTEARPARPFSGESKRS